MRLAGPLFHGKLCLVCISIMKKTDIIIGIRDEIIVVLIEAICCMGGR